MVYFIQPVGGGPIKIGHTGQLSARIACLQSNFKRKFVVLATFPGGRDEERRFHRKFSHLRLGRTEQFRPAKDLMDFLDLVVPEGSDPLALLEMPSSRKGHITVQVPSKLHRHLKILALQQGMTLGSYLARVLEEEARLHPESRHAYTA